MSQENYCDNYINIVYSTTIFIFFGVPAPLEFSNQLHNGWIGREVLTKSLLIDLAVIPFFCRYLIMALTSILSILTVCLHLGSIQLCDNGNRVIVYYSFSWARPRIFWMILVWSCLFAVKQWKLFGLCTNVKKSSSVKLCIPFNKIFLSFSWYISLTGGGMAHWILTQVCLYLHSLDQPNPQTSLAAVGECSSHNHVHLIMTILVLKGRVFFFCQFQNKLDIMKQF